MSGHFWHISEIGNGYVIEYPSYYEGNLRQVSYFVRSFDEALQIFQENSQEPTPMEIP